MPQVSDFTPLKVLGTGSFGKVVLVKNKVTGKLYAQKQLRKDTMKDKDYLNTINERTILAKISHPNVVKLHYALQDFNKVYLILEYLSGGELFYHLRQEHILSEDIAAFYAAQMILAIRHLHLDANVIYRDLKPENCLLNESGHLVLTDFGLSAIYQDFCSSKDGTAQYMAPEVIKSEKYDGKCDWWSLGAVLFDLITGNPPFTGNNNKRIMEKIISKKISWPIYMSQFARQFLQKLLNKNADKRLNLDDNAAFESIKSDPFFRKIDWVAIESQRCVPPIRPVIVDPESAENFDDEFTSMEITPPNSPISKVLYDEIQESRSNSTSSIIKIKRNDNSGELKESVYFTDFSFSRDSFLDSHLLSLENSITSLSLND
ncbi:hypothetical protein DAMA08_046170 [Martiniozyma asiatica (nom. inval.)]|nr:hypothetical protein DAMA08_046170 [Martiniozyma asiatica]